MNSSDYKLVLKFWQDCQDAGIRNPALLLREKRPQLFGWLRGCFPREILPTDVDGEVEINGKFLRFEYKHEAVLRSNQHVGTGQYRAFDKLVKLAPFTVVWVGVNNDNDPTCCEIWHHDRPHGRLRNCDRAFIKMLSRKWSAFAEPAWEKS